MIITRSDVSAVTFGSSPSPVKTVQLSAEGEFSWIFKGRKELKTTHKTLKEVVEASLRNMFGMATQNIQYYIFSKFCLIILTVERRLENYSGTVYK